jgi:hypothetical protein
MNQGLLLQLQPLFKTRQFLLLPITTSRRSRPHPHKILMTSPRHQLMGLVLRFMIRSRKHLDRQGCETVQITTPGHVRVLRQSRRSIAGALPNCPNSARVQNDWTDFVHSSQTQRLRRRPLPRNHRQINWRARRVRKR